MFATMLRRSSLRSILPSDLEEGNPERLERAIVRSRAESGETPFKEQTDVEH